MAKTVPLDAAEKDLQSLLDRLHFGETVTLVSPAGTPEALLVSLKPGAGKPQPITDWDTRWDRLTEKVSKAWKSDKSAVDILAEMRR